MSARSNPLSYILSLESHAVGWKSVYAILELFIFKFQEGMNLLQPTGAWVCLSLQLVIRTYIPLFPEWLSEKMCTQQSRKVIGYDQYTVPDACSSRTYFCCFLWAPANIRPWPFVSFFQTSLENSEFKTTHLSGLSRALFPTPFLEIAVCKSKVILYSK